MKDQAMAYGGRWGEGWVVVDGGGTGKSTVQAEALVVDGGVWGEL